MDMAHLRALLLSRDGIEHYATTGYFLTWFAAVELGVDFMLRWACEVKDMPAYETLVRGLPPRSKCERVYAICKDKVAIGPNLQARLDHFAGRICTIRNHIAHSFAVHHADNGWVEFLSIGEITNQKEGQKLRARNRMRSLEVFEHGAWLHQLSTDLQNLNYAKPPSGTLEIAAPHSGLPKPTGQRSPKPESAAN